MIELIVLSLHSSERLISSYFFFFKQKTAYELRISDWSSVVCSSDLLRQRQRQEVLPDPDGQVPRSDRARPRQRQCLRRNPRLRRRRAENGRASCRERVCQYV